MPTSLPPRRSRHLASNSARAGLAGASLLTAGLLVGACAPGESKPVGDGKGAAGGADGGAIERTSEPLPPGFVLPPVVPVGAPKYEERGAAGAGSVTGVVELGGEAPTDTAVRVTADERACGATLVDRTVVRRGTRLGGAIVWLADLRAGKPLPLSRRFEIEMAKCVLVPRAQPALAGGTLNVKGRDPVRSRIRFVRRPSNHIASVVTMNDAGQVVPDERVLDSAGVVEVRGELHPWMRAWLLVFDHPYYAATGADGGFTLADVPPGTYRLVAWHERLGVVEQRVTVEAGKPTSVTLRLGAGAAPATVVGDSAARRDSTPATKGGR